jgi:hypothetical protein
MWDSMIVQGSGWIVLMMSLFTSQLEASVMLEKASMYCHFSLVSQLRRGSLWSQLNWVFQESGEDEKMVKKSNNG